MCDEQQQRQVLAVADTTSRGTDGPEQTWKFFGLKVGRKTEIIALAAFVLSISGVLWQIFNYLRGPNVILFPSDQIVMTSTEKLGRDYTGEANRVAFIVPMTYVNKGDIGHNAVVRRENIIVSLAGRQFEHRWYQFGSSDVKNGALVFNREREARAFPISGASAESHETLFAPWEVNCDASDKNCNRSANFVHWDDFIKGVEATKKLSLTMAAQIYSSNPVDAACVVSFRAWEIKILKKEQWLSITCKRANTRDRPFPF